MGQYFLEVDLEKLDQLGDIAADLGLEPGTVSLPDESFAQGFTPNSWKGKEVEVRIYDSDFPIFVATYGNRSGDPAKDKHLDVVKAVVAATDCERVVGGACEFDIGLFR